MSIATLLLAALAPAWQVDATRRISSRPDGSPAAASSGSAASVSADGRFAAFWNSDDGLVPGIDYTAPQIVVWERGSGLLTCASLAPGGAAADGTCSWPSMSADGRWLAFASSARNLDGWRGNSDNIYLADRDTGAVVWASPVPDDSQLIGFAARPKLSADGSRVAFYGNALNLVSPPLTQYEDLLYVFDAATGVVSLASVAPDGARWQLEDFDRFYISADGNCVVFEGRQGGTRFDVFLRKDLVTGELTELELTDPEFPRVTSAELRGLSGDATLLLFVSADPLVADDTNGVSDVYLRDLVAERTERVSLGVDDAELLTGSIDAGMSSDGRFVWFLHVGGEIVESDSTFELDLFVRDRLLGTTTQLSRGTFDEQQTDAGLTVGQMAGSDDGSLFAFVSWTHDLTTDDTLDYADVFVRERSLPDATVAHYGTGYPGRNGVVPTIDPRGDPVRGKTWHADVSCSAGTYTVAFVLIGVQPTLIPTRLGGDLLVDPLLTVPIGLSPAGGTFTAFVPDAWDLPGFTAYLQALELDPWASKGVSFTDGIEAVVGDR